MCGIAGIITRRGEIDARLVLDSVAEALSHRGPDDHGVHLASSVNGVAGICATRLAVRDLSQRGHQPMVGRTGSVIALNGELYNADDLRRWLEDRGCSFRGTSDTEVALCAYEECGDAFAGLLRGMFAVTVWDPRGGRLLLARDRLGIKPLYYCESSSSEFLYASELRALLPHLGRAHNVSQSGLAAFLATGAVSEPETMLEGVMMLPPGHVLAWSDGSTDLREYSSLRQAFEAPAFTGSRQEAVDELRGRLEYAVRSQLVSDAPLGIFLSGGIDSSTLVGLAATSHHGLSTASVVFSEESFSEAEHIRAVVDCFGTQHHEIRLTATDFLGEIPRALAAMDQPTFDGVNTYVVSKLAKASGLTVALSGLGGDELFAGYELFKSIPRLETMRAVLPRTLKGLAVRAVARRYGPSDRGQKLARWIQGEPADALELQRELFGPESRTRLLAPEPAELGGNPDQTAIADRINRISYHEIRGYMRNVLLRDADVMSMAHGLELRVPLLDDAIVDFVATVPGHVKTDGKTNKSLLVDAVADILPASVKTRPKAGFTLPFEEWLRGPLKAEVEDKLRDAKFGGQIADLLEPAAVQAVWRDFVDGATGWTRPWSLYVLKEWGAQHSGPLRYP